MSQFGGLSGEGFQRSTSTGQGGSTSFNDIPANSTSAIRDTEDDIGHAIDEGAIGDDAEQWEDEPANEKANGDKFQITRVDSSAIRPSDGPSLLTFLMKKQSTSALWPMQEDLNGPSLVVSPNDSDDTPWRNTNHAPPMRPIIEVPCTTAQPINATAYNQVARCNMLKDELPLL
jgi:hypothetical protein